MAGKKQLTSIHTHRVRDKHGKVDHKGGFVHEHHYEDADGNKSGPHFGGVSNDLADVQQHMQDNFGAQGGQQDDSQQGAEPDGGGAPPAGGPPAGGPPAAQ